MSQSNEGMQGGQGAASTLSKEQILNRLKDEGITDLEGLVAFAADKASQTDEQGNPVVVPVFQDPTFFVFHGIGIIMT
jgi:hypothetical protein